MEPTATSGLRSLAPPWSISELNPCEAHASVQYQDDSRDRQVDLASARCDVFGHMFSFDAANHCHLDSHHAE